MWRACVRACRVGQRVPATEIDGWRWRWRRLGHQIRSLIHGWDAVSRRCTATPGSRSREGLPAVERTGRTGGMLPKTTKRKRGKLDGAGMVAVGQLAAAAKTTNGDDVRPTLTCTCTCTWPKKLSPGQLRRNVRWRVDHAADGMLRKCVT